MTRAGVRPLRGPLVAFAARCAIVLTSLSAGCRSGAARSDDADSRAATTVYLVRHAEKDAAAGVNDPGLSPAGAARAARLAARFRETPLSAVYASAWRRAQDTARPIAASHGLAVVLTPATRAGPAAPAAAAPAKADHPADAAALASMILAEHAGRRVLVVGHSNTLPLIVDAFLHPGEPARVERAGFTIADDQYNALFIITIGAHGDAMVAFEQQDEAPSP